MSVLRFIVTVLLGIFVIFLKDFSFHLDNELFTVIANFLIAFFVVKYVEYAMFIKNNAKIISKMSDDLTRLIRENEILKEQARSITNEE